MKVSLLKILGVGTGIACVVLGVAFCASTQLAQQQQKRQQEIQQEQRAKETDMGGHQLQRW
jgi:hypothetical protein